MHKYVCYDVCEYINKRVHEYMFVIEPGPAQPNRPPGKPYTPPKLSPPNGQPAERNGARKDGKTTGGKSETAADKDRRTLTGGPKTAQKIGR